MPKLAINGGAPVVTRPLGKPWPIFGEEEEQNLHQVLHSAKWWRGAHADPAASMVGQFEDAFAKFQDAEYAMAVTSGTTALECALQAVGVRAGDEVVLPAATFISVATAVLHVGATPVFCDINPRDYNLSVADAEAKITGKTRAIIAVDNGGMPCDMDALADLSRRRGVAVVSDCAHSHGSQWKGKGTGALSDAGIFSFQMSKLLAAGEGGMLLTNDAALIERAFSYHNTGRVPGRPFAERPVPASNLRMTEWVGAIGLAQLSRLAAQIETREANCAHLRAGMAEVEGLEPINRDPRVTRWGFYFCYARFHSEGFGGISRDTFLKALAAEGVPAHKGHTLPLYRHPVFQELSGAGGGYGDVVCPEVERVHATESFAMNHPLFLGPREEMDLVLEAFRKLRANVDELRRLE